MSNQDQQHNHPNKALEQQSGQLDRRTVTDLSTAILDRAKKVVPQIRVMPGTVQAVPSSGRVYAVLIDDPTSAAPIYAENITGSLLSEGQRVMVMFVPPQGAFVFGVIGLQQWRDYTPTLAQSGAVSFTKTYARWTRLGSTVFASAKLSVTGAGSINNAVVVGLPVAASLHGIGVARYCGWLDVYDASQGTDYKGEAMQGTSALNVCGVTPNNYAAGSIGLDPQFALASGDEVNLTIVYEGVQP